jgi:transcription initiation factor TFIID TATA-box-binding protein
MAVATVQLGTPVDVERVAITVSNAEYNPRRFSAVILRVREPRTTALVFKSGKMVVTGARSEEDSLAAAHKYVAILQKVGCPATCKDFRIQNMTAMWNLGFPVRLEGLLFAHSAQSTYEPELFPGLVFRLQDPKVVFIVFVSGKVVITGVKSMAALENGVGAFLPVLTAFRKKPLLLGLAVRGAKKQRRI